MFSQSSRNRQELLTASRLPQSFVGAEDKRAIANDRAAAGAAKLILSKGRLGRTRAIGKEIVGVQFVMAQEFPHIAVEFVGAGLRHDRGEPAASASEPPARSVGNHLEFLH